MERENSLLDSSENENENSYLGGVVRNIFRSISYLTRIESMGRLPIRHIGNSANKLGQITDVLDKLHNAYQDIKEKNLRSRFHSIFHISIKAYHDLLKSGVLGGILFTIYEDLINQMHYKHTCCLKLSPSNQSLNYNELVFSPSLIATCAGTISGGTHGFLSSLWDRTLFSLTKHLKLLSVKLYTELTLPHFHINHHPQFYTLGTCLSHSLVHGSLFGSYELTKRLCLYLMNLTHETTHLTKIEGGISILIGGISAGFISETIGILTSSFEEKGIQNGILLIRQTKLQLQLNNYSIRSIGPTVLGFLAYEYTKEGVVD